MSNTELIKELRALTSAGMKDCKDALEETGWDVQKAVDVIKVKGLNIASGREGKVAAEGRVGLVSADGVAAMVEVNCQTDFVANSDEFRSFNKKVVTDLFVNGAVFDPKALEESRKEVVASTKENVVIRRWWYEEAMNSMARVFSYYHSNGKIGVILTMLAPSEDAAKDSAFRELGDELSMQIAAMAPLAIDPEHLSAEETARQKSIFEQQLTEMNKPQAAWAKILEGKFNKWHTEVCLLNQESVVHPKTSVAQVIKNVGAKIGGEVKVVNFIRCQVGEGIVQQKVDLADEVAKMIPLD